MTVLIGARDPRGGEEVTEGVESTESEEMIFL
jgi:hypothetical protein